MIKPDENKLWKAIWKERKSIRDIIKEVNINEKRAIYILQKWTDKGLYNYGISVLSGWIEDGVKEDDLK